MKKIILLFVIFLFLTGCDNEFNSIKKDLINKMDKSSGYYLKGNLKINNNDEVYSYKVEVGYKKDDYYKVVLTNEMNNHTQIILKNDEGVYVLTPSLNKSFKFQSDWPYNNSQIYLLNTIISDIKNNLEKNYDFKDNKYIFNTTVHYSNNNKLKNQKIIVDKKLNIEKVSVYDKNGIEVMKMKFNKINYSPKFSKDYFSLDKITDTGINNTKNNEEVNHIEDIIYPLFIPNGTKLVNEEKINKESGERVIMSFDGEKSFLLVEETLDIFNNFTVIPTSGEPYQIMDTMGIITDNSLSWYSGNIEYYLVSDVMSRDELIDIAQSIVGITSFK